MSTVIRRHVSADPQRVWAAVTDFSAHGRYVPLTTMLLEPGAEQAPGVGWRFIGRTRLGPMVLDDRMRLSRWDPPAGGDIGSFHAHKIGPVLTGWAAVQVRPGPCADTSMVTWMEHIRAPIRLPRPLQAIVGRLFDLGSALLFARVLDGLLRDLPSGPPGRSART